MTIESLLRDLHSQGIDVIYSSELVPHDALAPAARPNASLLQRATDALEAHGLVLRALDAHSYVVVRTPPKSAPLPPTPVNETLEEVSVYASRYSIEGHNLAEPRELSSADIETIPGSHDDALRALHALPGLASNASARPYIRGSLTEDVLVRYDGITIRDPFHFKNFQSLISAIDPATVERLEVFSGGFPVRYGTRSGGVIDMQAPSPASGIENRVGVSLISAGVSSIGHAETLPLEWIASLRRSTLDLLDVVRDGLGKPQLADSLGRVRYGTDNGAWTLGWLLLDDQLSLGSLDDEEQATARYRDEYFWLARDHRFSSQLRTRLTAVATSAERDRDGTLARSGVATGQVDEHSDFNGIELANDWTFEPSDRSTYTFGGAFTATRSESSYVRQEQFDPAVALAFGRPQNADVDVRANPRVTTVALYGARRHQWANFDAEVGLRLDAQHYDLGGDHAQVSPRLNIRYDISEHSRVFASAGRFTQAQHVEEWRIEEGQQTADPAQVSFHAILGFEYQGDDATRWGVEAYSKRWTTAAPYYDNRLDPFSLLPDLGPDRVRIDPEHSEASGLEVSVRRPFGAAITSWGTLTWSRVADSFRGSDDILRSWDQPLALTTGLAWKGTRANLSGLAAWHRGWPRSPFTLEPLTLEPRNSGRWGDYYSLDFRGSWTWPVFRGDLSAVLEVTNATDRQNECCVSFSRGVSTPGLTPEIDHWLPFIVNLGVSFRW